jgi:hypothetical protein
MSYMNIHLTIGARTSARPAASIPDIDEEDAMGLFRKHRTEMEPAAPPPAPHTMGQAMTDKANVAIDKASQIYHKNPKLIGGLAAVAGALLLSRMKRRPH